MDFVNPASSAMPHGRRAPCFPNRTKTSQPRSAPHLVLESSSNIACKNFFLERIRCSKAYASAAPGSWFQWPERRSRAGDQLAHNTNAAKGVCDPLPWVIRLPSVCNTAAGGRLSEPARPSPAGQEIHDVHTIDNIMTWVSPLADA